jgi:hypothetical protein
MPIGYHRREQLKSTKTNKGYSNLNADNGEPPKNPED